MGSLRQRLPIPATSLLPLYLGRSSGLPAPEPEPQYEPLPRARYVVPLGDLTQEERTPAQVHRLDALAETIGRPVLERLEDDPQTAPVIEAWLRNSDREQQVLNLTRTIVEELKVPRLRWRILNALRKLG